MTVDKERRELFIQTAGRTPDHSSPTLDQNPYYRDLVRVNIDTGELTTVMAGDFDVNCSHTSHCRMSTMMAAAYDHRTVSPDSGGISPTGNFAVVTHSRVNSVPVSLLQNRDGQTILELETADLSPLYASVSTNWKWPEPVKLTAADGTTEIYGVVYYPSDFDPTKTYPVIDHVMNTPELPWVPTGSFNSPPHCGTPYFDAAAVAELGFIVVQINGRGTNFRHKAFQDDSYGWIESVGNLEDHMAGIQQLAERYPYMDISRVGIYCPQGGTGATEALLRYPDFYKVAAVLMLLDSRMVATNMWSDKWQGQNNSASSHQYPEAYAENLQGKLLMVHGMLDAVVPPAIPFRIIEALQKANKDFDLVLLPTMGHSTSSYGIRRSWDYFIKHLQGNEPPKEFKITMAWER